MASLLVCARIAGLFFFGAVLCASSVADTPLPFGLRLSTAAETSPRPLLPGAPLGEATASLEAVQRRIRSLEESQGPYHPGLAPPLLEAAGRAEELGLFETAVDLYAWALHNTRVNRGLITTEQVPIVEALLALHRRTGDTESIAEREAYLYRLHGSGKPPWTRQKLTQALRYLEWRQEWLLLTEWSQQTRFVIDLHNDGLSLTRTVCEDPQWSAAWCSAFVLRTLGTLYLIEHQVQPTSTEDFPMANPRFGSLDRVALDDRLLTIKSGAYSTGVRLLEQALVLSPGNTDLQLALADWRWFQGRRGAARKAYRALPVAIRSRLNQAVPLPEYPVLPRDPLLSEGSEKVRARFTVSPSGRAQNIDVIALDSESNGPRSRARRALRETRFRPALNAGGETVSSEVDGEYLLFR